MIEPGTLLAVSCPWAKAYRNYITLDDTELEHVADIRQGTVVLVLASAGYVTFHLVLAPGPVLGWVPDYRLDPVPGDDP